jgi:glutamate-1-semialdehyde 2,1-aminomutase/spore coat polysaccharide biosynthesis protein SpsF
LHSLEKIFKKFKNKIAAVIMEPLTVQKPNCNNKGFCKNPKCHVVCQDSFLNEVQKIAKANKALLIFDEIITGFRFDYGGAQNLTGVTPDLSCFAKAISNGVPLSAIVGKKEYMSLLNKVFFSFTYGGDCIGLSASIASLKKIKEKQVIKHLYFQGKKLKDGLNILINDNNLQDYISCIGFDCRTIVTFTDSKLGNNLILKSFIQQELIKLGILWSGYHAVSYAHKNKEINFTLNQFDKVLGKLKLIIKKNQKINNFLEGAPVEPVFRKVTDFNSMMKKKP